MKEIHTIPQKTSLIRERLQKLLYLPITYLYAGGGIALVVGQGVILFQHKLGSGIVLTGVGLLLLLAGRAGNKIWEDVFAASRPVFLILAKKLEQFANRSSRHRQAEADSMKPLLEEERDTVPSGQDGGRETPAAEPCLSGEAKNQVSLRSNLETPVILTVPRRILIIIGSILVLASQPLLANENFILAIALLGPGLFFLVASLISDEYRLNFGKLSDLLKVSGIGLLGSGLILAGHIYIWKYMEMNMAKEGAGLILNAIGILLIYRLLPRVIPDTKSLDVPPLDQVTGEAKGRLAVLTKVGLVLLSLGLFFAARMVIGLNIKVCLSLAAITALGFSFPWSRLRYESAKPPEILLVYGVRLLRLAALGVALYLGYQGQLLISHSQLYPGLYRFALAVLAVLIALREPDSRLARDPLQEQPLKWYWEALGIMLLLGLGFWLRFYKLDIMPYGIECDEAGAAYEALDVLEGKFNSFIVHPCGRQIFMLWPKVVSFALFGTYNLGVRFAAVVWGTLGILLMHLMGRQFFGPRIGLAMAALFAVSRWHIHFSRFGWANTLMLVLLMIGFYFLVKGLSSNRKANFLLAGIALSLSIQTETAARMVPIMCFILLVYFFFTYPQFLKRYWKQIITLMLGVWLAGAGTYLFWLQKPHLLTQRVYEVSIFSEDPNAPRNNVLQGFIESTKHTLTQLNWHGDYRTRHNGGLSGEPVVDFWTAILFVLGMGFSIYYWKRLRYFLPLLWFFSFMAASIFALEAPQSHRAFGVLPAVIIFIGAFLDRSRRLLRETLGRPGIIIGTLIFLVFLVFIGKINYQKYFNAVPGFDTNCTAAAKNMGKPEWKDALHVVMSARLWMGHPPFKLYARGVESYFFYRSSEIAPIRREKQQDVLYTFILEYPPLLPVVQWFYPQGVLGEETHPKYGLQFKSWGVKQEDILRTRGLKASYWDNSSWAGSPALTRKDANLEFNFTPETWPVAGLGSVAWEGTIFIPHEGEYILYAYATDYIDVRVGLKIRLQAGNKREIRQRVWLAGGLHTLRAKAKYLQPQNRVLFAWSCDQEGPCYLYGDPHQKSFIKQAVPPTHFFTYPEPIGLLETLYGNENWEGKPLRQTVEPVPFFYWHGTPHGFTPPFSADWRGQIKINRPGDYKFEIQHAGFMELEIAGKTVFHSGQPPDGRKKKTPLRNPVYLEKGEYPIFMRWSAHNGWVMKLWWIPPGGERELVPAWILSPAAE